MFLVPRCHSEKMSDKSDRSLSGRFEDRKDSNSYIRADILRYGSLPIILDGILTNLLDPDETLKNMTEMIKQEAENNIQVFEILETNSSDKFSKNNKIAALLNKSNNKVNQETQDQNISVFNYVVHSRFKIRTDIYCILINER